ncbi:hypothetical protein [Reinekea sp. G2M2-21]|uniref:hypothetical protein n=1 Tax=Reinekea sp. G2M2-21 TaxID=2788942 RepID=UPI0018AC8439|nr:hypothetical protein [Reinekea sp. G2M2-21]
MNFTSQYYSGTGINHDREEFSGSFKVEALPGTQTKAYRYIATRTADNTKVHEEVGLITINENNEPALHVHMEEMPCTTVHKLKEANEKRWVFEYKGHNQLAGFTSELVFEFDGDKFKYLHRWAMGGEVSDKSWCLLEPK